MWEIHFYSVFLAAGRTVICNSDSCQTYSRKTTVKTLNVIQFNNVKDLLQYFFQASPKSLGFRNFLKWGVPGTSRLVLNILRSSIQARVSILVQSWATDPVMMCYDVKSCIAIYLFSRSVTCQRRRWFGRRWRSHLNSGYPFRHLQDAPFKKKQHLWMEYTDQQPTSEHLFFGRGGPFWKSSILSVLPA